jgi:protein-disulfide isomerase
MTSRFESALSTILVIAGTAMGIAIVHREFASAPVSADAAEKPQYVPDWKGALASGYIVGADSPKVTIVELVDLECPACARYHGTIRHVISTYPKEVSVVYVPFPLSIHRFATRAARAAECAYKLGQLEPWMNAVFAQQDSLGITSWGAIAHSAGIRDTSAISRCAADTTSVLRLQAGKRFAESIHAHATPTIIINGWKFPELPNAEDFDSIVVGVRRGADPSKILAANR